MPHPADSTADDRRLRDHPLLGPLRPAPSVRLTFDGRPIEARAGEPIVAALLADGVRVFRTMPGSGESRGGWCMVGRCGDCAVVVDGLPDVPACVTPVADGMTVRTQHGLGDDAWDLAPTPASAPVADDVADRSTTRRTEVAVVGAGPAGLAAAGAAARHGARTVLLDEGLEPGGRLRYRVAAVGRGAADESPAAVRAAIVAEAVAAGVDLQPASVVWGLFDGPLLAVADAHSSYQLAADAVVLATGATDLAAPFLGASLPGVWTGRALQILLNLHRVRPGRRVAVLGAGPEAAEVAADVRLAKGEVALTAAIDPIGADVAAEGDGGVHAIVVAGRRHPVDVVAVTIGRQPDAALAQMAGCPMAHHPALGGWAPLLDAHLRAGSAGIVVAGDAAGVTSVETALAEGRLAGTSAAASLGLVGQERLAEEQRAYEAACPDRAALRRRLTPAFAQAYEWEATEDR